MSGISTNGVVTENDRLKTSAIVSYAIGTSTGRQFITALVSTYILIFFTDTFGIPAASAGSIMFFATIWDAINDPMMGTLADRTKSRWGRYRPYLLLIPIPLAIVSVLLFAAPDLSVNGKIAYGAVLYICYGMLVTAIEIPFGALLPAMTNNPKERTRIVQTYAFISSLVILVTTSFTTSLVGFLGGGNTAKGYMILIGIAGIILILSNILTFIVCKERHIVTKNSSSIREDIKELLTHKEILPILIIWAMGCLGFNIMMASSIYYCLYYLARPDLIPSYMLTISIGGMVGIMVLVAIFMKIFKGNVKRSFVVSQLLTVVCYVALFIFGGKSLLFLYIATFIASMFSTMSNAYIPLIGIEITDYIAYRTGKQLNATIAAIRGFSYKCGTALTGGIIGAILAATGYVPGNIGGQTEIVKFGINASRFLIPIAAGIILCLCFIPYPVTEELKAEMRAKREGM
jgi:sugar (glycoside-pentoside-hexuronide) transporter